MTDELLPYYSRELAFLRKMGAQFADAHPKIAGRLRMSGEAIEDPHVSRMIEAFAYLNARTRYKIEDDFPEITEAFLNTLYPHYLAPFPSTAIARFTLDRAQAELTAGHSIPRRTAIETEVTNYGTPCRFRTCYPVTAWPLELVSAEFQGQPFSAPATAFTRDAQAVIRLELASYSDAVAFDRFEIDRLRFFLNGSEPFVYTLYELLLNHVLGVAVCPSVRHPEPRLLYRDAIQPVGFERDEGLIDYSPRSFLGYRLLNEFFVFPQKFLFLDLLGLTPELLAEVGNQPKLELYVYLNRYVAELEQNVERDTFLLGCTPMVNLYPQRAEPIRLSHTQSEYHVIPDARHPLAHEVFSVDRVTATSPTHETVTYAPFYSLQHESLEDASPRFWHASRRVGGNRGSEVDRGTEVYLSLVDLDFDPHLASDWTLDIETTCLNRDLPGRLPFGGGQPTLHAQTGGLAAVQCVTAPTKTFRPALGHGTRWRLISHLTLNHLSLIDRADGADALREILRLYDLADSDSTRAMMEGLLSVSTRRIVGRVPSPVAAGFCRGLEVTLQLDEEKFTGSGAYLFSSVLDRFLGLYSSINSFTRTLVTTNKREGYLYRGPARAGEKVLL